MERLSLHLMLLLLTILCAVLLFDVQALRREIRMAGLTTSIHVPEAPDQTWDAPWVMTWVKAGCEAGNFPLDQCLAMVRDAVDR